jgi:hypothetical protein
MTPPSAGQHIAAIETVWSAAAQRERTPDDIVFAAHQHVSALDLRWRGNAALNICLGFAAATVRSPYQVTGYEFVLSIAIKDGIDIHNCDWPQQKTSGLEGVWEHEQFT